MTNYILAQSGKRTVICINGKDRGITRVASSVAEDFRKAVNARHCDIRVAGTDNPESGACGNADTVIVAGTLGEGGVIDQFVTQIEGANRLAGKRESYLFATIEYKGKDLLLVAGSDKLGTEYGLLKLSEFAGVSPWHYWGDVTVIPKDEVAVDRVSLNQMSEEPAVKLRGFFMNDEWPSLGNWVHTTFGGFNELFYEKVFDLLLRLRGNYLWPAMWTGVFSEDGKAFPTASAELASELGIVMGTSHHEPLFRAGEEFSHLSTDSNDVGYGKDWSYHKNARGLYSFWEDSVRRNRDFASLITVGMRGERDSKILGENATLQDNIDLLKRTITDQKKILSDNGLEKAQKVLALYKEVEDYYYGDSRTEGLTAWNELDDTMLLLSDDNYGNLRTLPSEKTRDRKAGWGIYYHFDYHGGPISYEWVNSTPITKAWEQLTTAYAYGVRDLWVANVGDLRPCELPLSYFMKLAFDFEKWSEPNRTGEFLRLWVEEQFGGEADEATLKNIAAILDEYTRLNGDRRPEATHADTFRDEDDNEALSELYRAQGIISLVEKVRPLIPESRKNAFYGLVEFPALASANLRKMMIYAGLHKRFAARGVSFANELRERVLACIDTDIELVRKYNEEMTGGKWNHMMSSKHVDFVNWNEEGSKYPAPEILELPDKGKMIVSVSGSEESASEGTLKLPVFTNTDRKEQRIVLMNSGRDAIEYDVRVSENWICIQRSAIGKNTYELKVSVDWSALSDNAFGTIFISSAGKSVEVGVEIVWVDTDSFPGGVFVEAVGVISMPADRYTRKKEVPQSEWIRIDNYGKATVAMKAYPLDRNYTDPLYAPFLEYNFVITHAGSYTITAYIAPGNNPAKGKGLHLAIGVDGTSPVVLDTLPEGFAAGDTDDMNWCRYVLDNGRKCEVTADLSKGLHTLRFIQMDAGIVLQKIEIAKRPSRTFYGYLPTFQKA
jgi:hypothetical protein